MLSLIVKRLRLCKLIGQIVVATTKNVRDDPIATLCQDMNVPIYRGKESDVLDRYYSAARHFGAKTIVRVTADCPFVDPGILQSVVELLHHTKSDYVSNTLVRTYPDGLDVEAFTFSALTKAHREAKTPELREHVTLYFNGRRAHLPFGKFTCTSLMLMQDLSDIRWTVDLPEDLIRIQKLAQLTDRHANWKDIFQVAHSNNLLPTHRHDTPKTFL